MGPMSHEPGTVRPAGSQARATAAARRRRPASESRYGRQVRLDSITVQPVVKLDSWPQINSWLSLANLSNSESIMALRLRPGRRRGRRRLPRSRACTGFEIQSR